LDGIAANILEFFMVKKTKPRRMWAPTTYLAIKPSSGNGGYAEAMRRGEELACKLWNSKEMLTSSEAGRQLGITPSSINRYRRAGKLLGLRLGNKGGYRYPAWQFNAAVFENVAVVMLQLSNYSVWNKYLFFRKKEPLLGAKTPLSLLRKKKSAEVLRVARILNSELH
jgi:hypothetical protein